MKKLHRIRVGGWGGGGGVKRGDFLRKGRGFPNCYISFPSGKLVFITS